MALSVLHKISLTDNLNCGVWCSITEKWVFNGVYERCFSFKNEVENVEQQSDNAIYFAEFKEKRRKMFGGRR